jgi:tRNA modification GTPase
MPPLSDTIAAPATPAGTAALALLRVSGPDTERIARELGGRRPEPRRARHLEYRSRGGGLLDDVVVVFYAGPRSYTGEDALEITCHGSPLVAQRILEDLLARGCRLAGPGEFTQRAFLNGKMDLSQAEGVMEVIQARSERALAAAQHQLRGGLTRRLNGLVDDLLGVLARIEAYIDFPEEDLPPEETRMVADACERIELKINELRETSRYGEILRDGIRTVILGAPNAGKSSLLNRLVGKDRALVSAEPGTTRDFIEERIIVGPHCLRLVDTAGVHAGGGAIERMGIERTYERAAEADLFLLVVDAAGREQDPCPPLLRDKLRPADTLVVLNKSDLPGAVSAWNGLPGATELAVSALTGAGVDRLREVIVARADAFDPNPHDSIAINARHAEALQQARDLIRAAVAKLRGAEPTELVASDLRGVLDALGRIVGRIDNERMLDRLFASFCIGK